MIPHLRSFCAVILAFALVLVVAFVARASRFDDGNERTTSYVTAAHQLVPREVAFVAGAVGTQTLPALTGDALDVSVKNIGATTVHIVGASATDTIDGVSAWDVAPGASVTLIAAGTDLPGQWFIVQ